MATALNPIDIDTLFKRAGEEYGQTAETFYISSKNLDGLHFAVLPPRDEYIFSFFNFGDDDDVTALNTMWHDLKIFKTFGCTLCPIQKEDNAVVVSNTQNQLYLDPDTPSVQVQTQWRSPLGRIYIITATVPQYYYNHLLFVSEDHIPTYGVFTNRLVFQDVFEYLTAVYSSDQKVTAVFNGAFGSDIFHFHLHLTNQNFFVIESLWESLQSEMTAGLVAPTYYNVVDLKVIRGAVFASTDIGDLFRFVQKIAINYISSTDRKTKALTANFSARELTEPGGTLQIVYMVFFQWIDLNSNKPGADRTSRLVDGCQYFLLPPGYVIRANCFNINPSDYARFENTLAAAFDDVYMQPDINVITNILTDEIDLQNFSYGGISTAGDLELMPVEKVYTLVEKYFDDYIDRDVPLPEDIRPAIESILQTGTHCFLEQCDWEYDAKYRYLIGMYVATLAPDTIKTFLSDPSLEDLRIAASIKYLYNYNGDKQDMIQSDYLYFKGTFLASLLRKTFNNLILVTGAGEDQGPSINKWIDFIFNRIGEPSASGVNTISKLLNAPTVDFVMKIMPLADIPTFQTQGTIVINQDKLAEFQHEYFTSLQINELRQYIPNYILCYGGFHCGSDAEFDCDSSGSCYITNVTGLCTEPLKMPLSYILLENIKNSRTVARHIKLPNLTYPGEADDYADMALQIFIALIYGWELKNFTHYDLHVDNVMVYDFVKNPNYLKLFKIWDEYEGSKIPKIEGIYFIYHGLEYPIIIPAKYLYLIIDYGSAYVTGLSSYHTFPGRVQHIGMTSDRPKSVSDVYTFSMSLLFNIIMYKPYLIFDEANSQWLDNKLSRIFTKVLRAYGSHFKDVEKIVRDLPQMSGQTEHSRWRMFRDYFYGEAKPGFIVSHFQYLHKDFDETLVDNDFNSPIKVVNWIYTNLYDSADLQAKLSNPDAYVFNWGGPYLPKDVLQGIQPNDSIKELVSNRKEQQKQDISRIRSFTNQLN